VIAKIDTHALLQVIYGSALAVVAITTAFAVLLYGLVRSADLRREGHSGASARYAVLAGLGLAGFAAAVVYGFFIILQK
jgi:hypothetical protein